MGRVDPRTCFPAEAVNRLSLRGVPRWRDRGPHPFALDLRLATFASFEVQSLWRIDAGHWGVALRISEGLEPHAESAGGCHSPLGLDTVVATAGEQTIRGHLRPVELRLAWSGGGGPPVVLVHGSGAPGGLSSGDPSCRYAWRTEWSTSCRGTDLPCRSLGGSLRWMSRHMRKGLSISGRALVGPHPNAPMRFDASVCRRGNRSTAPAFETWTEDRGSGIWTTRCLVGARAVSSEDAEGIATPTRDTAARTLFPGRVDVDRGRHPERLREALSDRTRARGGVAGFGRRDHARPAALWEKRHRRDDSEETVEST